jgi:hypothetical protein
MTADGSRPYDLNLIQAALSAAIGPAPWYLTDRPCQLSFNGQSLVWNEPDLNSPYGPHTLLSDETDVYAAIRTPTVAGVLEGNRLVIVYRRKSPPTLALHFIEAETLRPITNYTECANHLANEENRYYINPETPVTRVLLPRRVQPGTHVVRFPKSLQDVAEFLVVSYLATHDDLPENRQAAIFCINPIMNQVQIISLDWYNHSDEFRHDGTQWIARAAREPLSGRIVGEGVRMGQFVLSEDNSHVEEWLSRTDSHLT